MVHGFKGLSLLTYYLFNDAQIMCHRMMGLMNWIECEGSGFGLIEGAIAAFVCKDWGETTKTCQNSVSPGTRFKPESPEYEVGVLTTRPRCSVRLFTNFDF
jgi:hypothetical protein